MIDLSEALETAPNVLVSNLPASDSVDLVLSEFPNIGESTAPHMASPACLPAWDRFDLAFPDALASCANPETLEAALEQYRNDTEMVAAIVTNPSAPRSPAVVEATKQLVEHRTNELLEAFADQYATPRRAEFEPTQHWDLISELLHVASEAGDKEYLLDYLVRSFSANLPLSDYRIPHDHLFPDDLAQEIDQRFTERIRKHNSAVTGRNPDGSLTFDQAATGLSPDLLELLSQHPSMLTGGEQKRLRDMIRKETANLPVGTQFLNHLADLGHHALHLRDFQEIPWLRGQGGIDVVMEPTPGVTYVWVEEWIGNGLIGGPYSMAGEDPWPLVRRVGDEAWAAFGDNPSAWALFTSFLQEGWEGSLQSLLETVTATA